MILHNTLEILCFSQHHYFECEIGSENSTKVKTKTLLLNGKRFEPTSIKRIQRVYDKPVTCFFERKNEQARIWDKIICDSGKRALRGYVNKPKTVLPPSFCDDFPYCNHEWHSRL